MSRISEYFSSKKVQNQEAEPSKTEPTSKFKVLGYNQAFMSRLGIHSQNLIEPSNEFFKSPVSYVILFVILVFVIISSAMYMFKNFTDFELAIQAFVVVIAGIQTGGMFISIGLKMKTVKMFHIKLQEFVDKGWFCSEYLLFSTENFFNFF